MSRRSSEFVPQFKAEGHGNQLGVAVPHQLCAGRVARAPEPPAEARDQTDGVAEARRRRQRAHSRFPGAVCRQKMDCEAGGG